MSNCDHESTLQSLKEECANGALTLKIAKLMFIMKTEMDNQAH